MKIPLDYIIGGNNFCLAGNDLDYSVNGIADFVIMKMSGGGENNVLIGSEYFIGNDNNITPYKLAHASSSSGVSQSFDRAASLASMVSGRVSISCNKTERSVMANLCK